MTPSSRRRLSPDMARETRLMAPGSTEACAKSRRRSVSSKPASARRCPSGREDARDAAGGPLEGGVQRRPGATASRARAEQDVLTVDAKCPKLDLGAQIREAGRLLGRRVLTQERGIGRRFQRRPTRRRRRPSRRLRRRINVSTEASFAPRRADSGAQREVPAALLAAFFEIHAPEECAM